jgi:hypothetical protein
MWAQFCAMAQKDSLLLNKLTAKEIEELKKAITASICRQLWRNEGLYQFLNSTDPLIIELSAVLQKR